MSRGVNVCFLVGNVGQDPEIRTTGGGAKVARCSLATSRSWKDGKGNAQEKTEWHRLTFWDRVAEIVEQYVKKGDRLHIQGRIEYSEYEKDGQKRYSTEIVVQEMTMLGSKSDGETAPARPKAAAAAATKPRSPFDDDDSDNPLPF